MAKENDLLLNAMANPHMSITQFEQVGLNANNTSLESEDTYKKLDVIRNSPEFQTNGTFDDVKFHKKYEDVRLAYNQLAEDTHNDNLAQTFAFYKDDLFADIKDRNLNSTTNVVRIANPHKLLKGTQGIGSLSRSNWSDREVAQTSNILTNANDVDFENGDFSKAEWRESPDELALFGENGVNFGGYFGNFLSTQALAKWKEDGEHIDPLTKQKVQHHAGDLITDDLGNPFYKDLNGDSPYGEEILSKFDYLTVDHTGVNTYDFFDSDDRQKSLGGLLVREAVELIPMFIPGVSTAYIGTRLFLQTSNLMAKVGKMIAGSDNELLSRIEGFNESLATSTSDHSKQDPWAMENIINMAGDVVAQLAEQRWLFKTAPKLILGKDATSEKTLEQMSNTYKQEFMKNPPVTNINELFEASALAEAHAATKVKEFQTLANTIGEQVSRVYMTGITVADAYGEAKEAGAEDWEAALVTLGYAAGEWGILKSDLGKWILPELKHDRYLKKMVAKKLMEGRPMESVKAEVDDKVKLSWGKKLLQFGKDIYHTEWSANKESTLAAMLKTGAANALGEGVEETSEELLYDVVKGFGNLVGYISGTGTDYKPFDNMGLRYSQSFLGGLLGGAIGQLDPSYRNALKDYKNMTYDQAAQRLIHIIGEHEEQELIDIIDKMPINNRYLTSLKPSDKEEALGYKPGTLQDNMDVASKEMIKTTIQTYKDILASNGAAISDESLLNQQEYEKLLPALKQIQLQQTVSGANFLQDWNTARTELLQAELELRRKLEPSPETYKDSSKEAYLKKEAGSIKTLQEDVAKKQEVVNEYLNGTKAPLLIRQLVKEMSPIYMAHYNTPTNELIFAQLAYHKNYNKLTDDEKKEAHDAWVIYSDAERKDNFREAEKLSHNMSMFLAPILTDTESIYFKTKPGDKISLLQTILQYRDKLFTLLNNDAALKKEAERQTGLDVDVSDAFYTIANSVLNKGDNFENVDFGSEGDLSEGKSLEAFLIGQLGINNSAFINNISVALNEQTQEDYQRLRADKEKQKIAKYDLIDQLRAQTPVDADEEANIKNQISQLEQDIDQLDLQIDSIPENAQTTKQKVAKIRGMIGNEVFNQINTIIDPIIAQGYAHPELKTLAIQSLKFAREYWENYKPTGTEEEVNKEQKIIDDNIASIDEKINAINKLGSTPLLKILKQIQLSLEDTNLNIETLLTKTDALLESSVLDYVTLPENLDKAITSAMQVVNLFKGELYGAATYNKDVNNKFGVNVTINEVEAKYNIDESKRSNLAEIDAETAAVLESELTPIVNKLTFIKRLSDLNKTGKLREQNKTAQRTYNIHFNKFKNKLLGHDIFDDSWNKDGALDELNRVIKEFTVLSDSKAVNLSKDKLLKLEEERRDFESAIYNFFQKNKDKSRAEKAKIFKHLVFADREEGQLTATTTDDELSDASFAYWLISRASLDSKEFLHDYNTAIATTPKIAPLASQELAVNLAYATVLHGDEVTDWVLALQDAVKANILNNPDAVSKLGLGNSDMPLESAIAPRFLNTILIEGVPGSGKSSGVAATLVAMLKANKHDNILKNAWFAHIGENEAKQLAKDSGLAEATALSRASLLEKVTGGDYKVKDLNITKEGKVLYSNIRINNNKDRTEIPFNLVELSGDQIPSIIFIDEVGRYTTYEMDIIDAFAQKYGIAVITMGDLDQNTTEASSTDVLEYADGKSSKVNGALFRGYFIHSPKLGTSMRAANNHKAYNQRAMQARLQELYRINPSVFTATVQNFLNTGALTFSYFEDETGIYGDKVMIEDSLTDEMKQSITNMYQNLKIKTNEDGTEELEKVGYSFGGDEDSDIYQFLMTGTYTDKEGKEQAFKDHTDFFPKGSSQGKEADYYIVEPDPTLHGTGLMGTENKPFIRDIYTGMSRAKVGSLILSTNALSLIPEDGNPTFAYITSKAAPDVVTDTLRPETIKAAIDARKSVLDKVAGDKPAKYKKRSSNKATDVTVDKDDSVEGEEGESVFPAVYTPSISTVREFKPHIVNDVEIPNLIMYSHATHETGLVNQNGSWQPGKNFDQRVDSLNGIIKLSGKNPYNLTQSDVDEMIKLQEEIRNKAFYGNNADILKYLQQAFGDDQIKTIRFGYKKGSDEKGTNFNPKFTVDKKNERLRNIHATGANTEEPSDAKYSLFAIGTNGEGNQEVVLEIPLLILPNYKTILSGTGTKESFMTKELQDRLKTIYDNIVTQVDDDIAKGNKKSNQREAIIKNSLIRAIEADSKLPQVLASIIKLYNTSPNTIIFNKEGFQLSDYVQASGPFLNMKDKGKTNYAVEGFETREDSAIEYTDITDFAKDSGLVISKPMISFEGFKIVGNNIRIDYAQPGRPFVLVSDDPSVTQDNIVEKYYGTSTMEGILDKIGDVVESNSKTQGNAWEYYSDGYTPEHRRIKVVYINPPVASIEEFAQNLINITKSKDKTTTGEGEAKVKPIGNLFTTARILAIPGVQKLLEREVLAKSPAEHKASRIKKWESIQKVLEKLSILDQKIDAATSTEEIKNLRQQQIDLLKQDDINTSTERKRAWGNIREMRYMLTRLIGDDNGKEFTVNDTKVQEVKDALEDAGIKNIYYDPIYDKSSIDKSGNTPIVELTDLGKPYRIPGKIDTAVVVGDLTDPLSDLIDHMDKSKKDHGTSSKEDLALYLGTKQEAPVEKTVADKIDELLPTYPKELRDAIRNSELGKKLVLTEEDLERFLESEKRIFFYVTGTTGLDKYIFIGEPNSAAGYMKAGDGSYITNFEHTVTAINSGSTIKQYQVEGFDYKEDMSDGSHDRATYIMTIEDGSVNLAKNAVYDSNLLGGYDLVMTKPTDEAKQTLQPFTDIATFVDLQNQSGSLTDEAKVEFMQEVDNILHEMIKEDSATVNNLFGSVFDGTYDIDGKTFTIKASSEAFDQIVENFNSIEGSRAKKTRYKNFDTLIRGFIDYAHRLGNSNTIINTLYDSMHTTEPINNSEDTSWESCNIIIR